ncbi:MAG: signal peptidase II [Firmicutes bacterium]|nr:signal peptidase II [Bacillota bacterium]
MRSAVWRAAAAAVVAFGLDFASKRIVERALRPGETVPLLPGVFDLTFVRNSGAAFSLLQGHAALLVVVTFAVFALFAAYWKELAALGGAAQAGAGLVLGGAMGNLVDRLRYGEVIDFLHLHHWPVFNVADTCVVTGGLLVAWAVYRGPAAGEGRHET